MSEWKSADVALLTGLRRVQKIEAVEQKQAARHQAKSRGRR